MRPPGSEFRLEAAAARAVTLITDRMNAELQTCALRTWHPILHSWNFRNEYVRQSLLLLPPLFSDAEASEDFAEDFFGIRGSGDPACGVERVAELNGRQFGGG